MIKHSEINKIRKIYFNIIQTSTFTVTFQFKNIGHYWHIVEEKTGLVRHFQVFHKHNQSDEYHRHKDSLDIETAINRIMEHDEFQMNGRKK